MGHHQAFFIVNKNGSLVYTKVMSMNMQSNLSTNDYIRLSSTFHSIHAISSQIVPEGAKEEDNPLLAEPLFQGINEIVTQSFTLKCMQTHTGMKFIIISAGSEKIREQEKVLQQVYEVFADFVGKNPFQENDMPIKSDLFD